LRERLSVRTVYADLDGTLLGPGGSLFASVDGVTAEPAEAIAAMATAGIDLVLMSGRTRAQISEVARVVGARAFIAELGGLIVYREGYEDTVIRQPGVTRGRGTAHEAIERSGAAGFLLDSYPALLEPHAPWSFVERECSVLLRGHVDVSDANQLLRNAGYGWLELQDNGVIPRRGRFPGLDVEEVRAYHLVPAGISKRSAVGLDRERRDLPREACIAVGDSASDGDVASEVGAAFIVANGEPGVRGLSLEENVYMTDRGHGLGFADAVLPFLP
jgi:hydroxymethylpyrimidine pyrophosphatase-like HAD family hydrolase